MEKKKIQWHSGFSAALRITLGDEMELLEMREEYLLGRKPLQMDVLIIKNQRNIGIKKQIGRIFRKHNIIEYKSPEDSLSINDFYKVYGYACIYQANTDAVKEIDPEELTITFVCSHYPREMMNHLFNVRGIRAEQKGEGIYWLTGDAIAMQLLITPKLSGAENYWLQKLRTDLKAGEEIRDVMRNYEKHRKIKDYEAVMDLITRANWNQMKEEKKMCEALKELFAEELREADKKGRTEGMELAKKIFQLSAKGTPVEKIAEECGLPVEKVREMLE